MATTGQAPMHGGCWVHACQAKASSSEGAGGLLLPGQHLMQCMPNPV